MKEVKELEFSYCHCEEDNSTKQQSIVSRRTRAGLSLRLLAHSGSPRACSPRDDKDDVGAFCLSLRGGRQDDAAIHRVSAGRGRVCLVDYWLTVDRHGLSALG